MYSEVPRQPPLNATLSHPAGRFGVQSAQGDTRSFARKSAVNVTVQGPCDPIPKISTLSNFDQKHSRTCRMGRFHGRRSVRPQILASAARMCRVSRRPQYVNNCTQLAHLSPAHDPCCGSWLQTFAVLPSYWRTTPARAFRGVAV
jgi:hypothetical protein